MRTACLPIVSHYIPSPPPPPDLPTPRHTPRKEPSTRDTHTLWTDRLLWKHYLPATFLITTLALMTVTCFCVCVQVRRGDAVLHQRSSGTAATAGVGLLLPALPPGGHVPHGQGKESPGKQYSCLRDMWGFNMGEGWKEAWVVMVNFCQCGWVGMLYWWSLCRNELLKLQLLTKGWERVKFCCSQNQFGLTKVMIQLRVVLLSGQ